MWNQFCVVVSHMHPDAYVWCPGNKWDLFSVLRSVTLGLRSNMAFYMTSTQLLNQHSALMHFQARRKVCFSI